MAAVRPLQIAIGKVNAMNKKNLLSLALSAALTLSLATPALAAQETTTPWYAEAQAYVESASLMTGTGQGFDPTVTVTRATVLQTLYNMEGKPAVSAGLADVEGKWYADAVNWAAANGLHAGETFGEDAVITRSGIATLIGLYADLKGGAVIISTGDMESAPDYASIPADALEGMSFCYYGNVMVGDQEGNLNPAGELTRAEFAQVLLNFSKLELIEKPYTEETVSIEVPETDGVPAHTIPAIVTMPTTEGKVPAVVMLHGTGSDKHEAGGGYDLAAPVLAEQGIATIRIDFMGSGDSAAAYADYSYTSANVDAKAAADYMAGLANVDPAKLGVMGWSQGGTNALLAAAAYPDTFQAVATWSGAVSLDGATLFPEGFHKAYETAKADGTYTMKFDWREDLELGLKWFEDVESTDVLEEVAKIAAPVFAINGDQDTTVTPDNAAAIEAAAKKGSAWLIEGADHTYNVFTEAGHAALLKTAADTAAFFQSALNGTLSGQVSAVSKYGNIGTTVSLEAFAVAGYEPGDVLTVTVGGKSVDVPFGDAYSNVDTGKEVIVPDKESGTAAVAINMGNFAGTYGAEEGTPITFAMKEKAGYLEEYEIRNIDALRTSDRADYSSDQVFANFRPVVMGDIAQGMLYRSSSPVNPELGRNTYADGLIEEAGVRTVINLADSQEELEAYEGYAGSYYATLHVIPLNMGVDFADPDFAAKLKTGLEYMLVNDGPYLVHCTEGKDRAGFVTALLEALMGGALEEIKADYMTSFENYYHVEKDSDRYNRIAESNIMASLRMIAGLEEGADLSKADLQKAAEDYLTATVGLTTEQVAELRTALSTPAAAGQAA